MTTFKARFLNENAEYKAKFGNVIIVHDGYVPPYEGDYAVIPTLDDQTFDTKNKKMLDDFSVLKIPYEEVSNEGGGTTAIIAS